jgi:aminotransferase in exopolysaccharide biosynthesis
MSEMIPLSVPHVIGNEWLYVKECLDSEWLSSAGRYVERFEREIAAFTGSKFAIACVNGTAALQVALRLVGVAAGDEVIVPTLTFVAPVNAIRYLNAEPVFMDCDEYYNIDVEKTIEFLKLHTTFKNGFAYDVLTDRRIAAIIPVHVFGNAVKIDELAHVCHEMGIRIVEDATESLGTVYSSGKIIGRHTGTIGDIGCFSFNGNKIITTGGGGMIVTDDARYAERARYLTTQAKDDEVRYIHNEIGYNFRLTNIQAAIGVAQLEQLPQYLDIKKSNYLFYKEHIKQILGLYIADVPEYADNNHWMYALQIDKASYGRDRENLMALLAESKIQTRPVWYLNHMQKPFNQCMHYRIEKAFRMLDQTLNIPCSVGLTRKDIEKVIEALGHG